MKVDRRGMKVDRYNVYIAIHEWMDAGLIPQEGNLVTMLARLLRTDIASLLNGNISIDQRELMNKLSGPHGLTIYKMLLARRDYHD